MHSIFQPRRASHTCSKGQSSPSLEQHAADRVLKPQNENWTPKEEKSDKLNEKEES